MLETAREGMAKLRKNATGLITVVKDRNTELKTGGVDDPLDRGITLTSEVLTDQIAKTLQAIRGLSLAANRRLTTVVPNPSNRVGIMGTAALAGVFAGTAVIHNVEAALTERQERITITDVQADPMGLAYRAGVQGGFAPNAEILTVTKTDGEVLGDRPDLFLGKFGNTNLEVGKTYDATTYTSFPFGENIRSATPVETADQDDNK